MSISTITTEERQARTAELIVQREHEIEDYQVNIDNFRTMLEDMDDGDNDQWPAELLNYRNVPPQKIALSVPTALQERVSHYQYRDELRARLQTEKIEQAKIKRLYDALVFQLPEEKATALIQAAGKKRKGG